ncbi:MAG: hypothetical protein AAF743_01325 [Planctomycetota bacterium]
MSPTTPNFDGVGDSDVDQGQLWVGLRSGGGFDQPRQLQRSVIFFDISSIPADQVIVSAELTLSLNGPNAAASTAPAVDLFHSVTTNGPTGTAGELYSGGDFSDTGIDVAAAGLTSAPGTSTFDVTAFVAADYAADDGVAFRLQMDDSTTWFDPTSSGTLRYGFNSLGTGGPANAVGGDPVLTVTFEPIPEPLSMTGGIGLLGVVAMRRRRV